MAMILQRDEWREFAPAGGTAAKFFSTAYGAIGQRTFDEPLAQYAQRDSIFIRIAREGSALSHLNHRRWRACHRHFR